jgi:hypothetical protein
LDDVESKTEYYKNLICDYFKLQKLKNADIVKTLVQNEKENLLSLTNNF